MKEIFNEISFYPDYEVSNCGRIRTKSRMVRYEHSITGKEHFRKTESRLLKIYANNRTGYKFVQLYRDKKSRNQHIHRLVALVFINSRPARNLEVNHKDGNKHNNRVDNLEWVTCEYNHEHATQSGLKAKGEKIGTAKLTESMVWAIKWFLDKGHTHTELSKAFRISRPTITLIANSKTWKHIALTGKELEIK